MNSNMVCRRFCDLPSSTDKFLDKNSGSNIFYSFPWYHNFVQHIDGIQEQFRAFSVSQSMGNTNTDANLDPDALLLMRAVVGTKFQTRKLESMANYYTSLFGPTINLSATDLGGTCNGLATAIADDRPGWDQVNLNPMARDTPTFDAMNNALLGSGFKTEPYFCFGNWYLKTKGRSFDEYFEGLPSKLKNTVNRKRKQLESGKRGRFEIVTAGDALENAIATYEKIYSSSWKVPEPYPRFIRGLIRTCSDQGWLRLGVAYVDNIPAAAQIWIVYKGIANIYKLAYDERFTKTSVGSILTTNLMRHVMDVDQVHEVDYLTGDDSYKRDWMSDRRERWGILAYNLRTPQGLVLAGMNTLRDAAKRALCRP